jgi:hypothetical protein
VRAEDVDALHHVRRQPEQVLDELAVDLLRRVLPVGALLHFALNLFYFVLVVAGWPDKVFFLSNFLPIGTG